MRRRSEPSMSKPSIFSNFDNKNSENTKKTKEETKNRLKQKLQLIKKKYSEDLKYLQILGKNGSENFEKELARALEQYLTNDNEEHSWMILRQQAIKFLSFNLSNAFYQKTATQYSNLSSSLLKKIPSPKSSNKVFFGKLSSDDEEIAVLTKTIEQLEKKRADEEKFLDDKLQEMIAQLYEESLDEKKIAIRKKFNSVYQAIKKRQRDLNYLKAIEDIDLILPDSRKYSEGFLFESDCQKNENNDDFFRIDEQIDSVAQELEEAINKKEPPICDQDTLNESGISIDDFSNNDCHELREKLSEIEYTWNIQETLYKKNLSELEERLLEAQKKQEDSTTENNTLMIEKNLSEENVAKNYAALKIQNFFYQTKLEKFATELQRVKQEQAKKIEIDLGLEAQAKEQQESLEKLQIELLEAQKKQEYSTTENDALMIKKNLSEENAAKNYAALKIQKTFYQTTLKKSLTELQNIQKKQTDLVKKVKDFTAENKIKIDFKLEAQVKAHQESLEKLQIELLEAQKKQEDAATEINALMAQKNLSEENAAKNYTALKIQKTFCQTKLEKFATELQRVKQEQAKKIEIDLGLEAQAKEQQESLEKLQIELLEAQKKQENNEIKNNCSIFNGPPNNISVQDFSEIERKLSQLNANQNEASNIAFGFLDSFSTFEKINNIAQVLTLPFEPEKLEQNLEILKNNSGDPNNTSKALRALNKIYQIKKTFEKSGVAMTVENLQNLWQPDKNSQKESERLGYKNCDGVEIRLNAGDKFVLSNLAANQVKSDANLQITTQENLRQVINVAEQIFAMIGSGEEEAFFRGHGYANENGQNVVERLSLEDKSESCRHQFEISPSSNPSFSKAQKITVQKVFKS